MLDLDGVLRALDRKPGDAIADGWVAPAASARAVADAARRSLLLVRALERKTGPDEKLDDLAGGARFGPAPPSLWFLAIDGESIALAPASGACAVRARVRALRIAACEVDWAKGDARRAAAELEIDLGPSSEGREGDPSEVPGTLVLGLGLADSDEAARARLAPYAAAVASATGAQHDAAPAEPGEAGALETLEDGARLAWSFEGGLVVLRDFADAGPSSASGAYRTAAIGLGVLAAGLWVALVRELATGGSVGAKLGVGAVALVLSIATYAFFEIARFAGKYRSESTPLAWFGDDRVVVAPWVSRAGAIDMRRSGSLGAAIRSAEVSGCRAIAKGDAFVAELATEHGPIEVARMARREPAERLAAEVNRVLASVAAAEKKKTALMRARARRGESPATT
jgi:hypothetical protein